MSLKRYLALTFVSCFIAGHVYSSCPALQSLLDEQTKLLEQSKVSRAEAWSKYGSNCGAGGATSNSGDKAAKGTGNMCIYKNGGEFRYINKDNTTPVVKCDLLKCFSASVIGYLGGSIASVVEYIGIDSITDSVFVDSTITSDCQASCKSWFTYDELINTTIPATIASLNAQSEALCESPCNGLTGDAYKKCECGRKNVAVWTWDDTKKDCIPCKSKEGQGYEYLKCICVNVTEGLWDEKDKTCYGTTCSAKTGDDYKRCICEIEKKGTWNVAKKVCNYVAPAPPGPGLPGEPGGPSASGDTSGTGVATATGAAAEEGASSGTAPSVGSVAGGGVDDATTGGAGKTKEKMSWSKRLLGLVGKGTEGSSMGGLNTYRRQPQSSAVKDSKADVGAQAKGPATDISKKEDEDIFKQVSKTYNARYQSELLAGKGVASGL